MSCPWSVPKRKQRQGKEATQSQICWDLVLDVLLSDQSFHWAGTDSGYCDVHLHFSSCLLPDACEPPKINYSPMDFVVHFSCPRQISYLSQIAVLWLGGNVLYLFISTTDTCCQILVEAEGYI